MQPATALSRMTSDTAGTRRNPRFSPPIDSRRHAIYRESGLAHANYPAYPAAPGIYRTSAPPSIAQTRGPAGLSKRGLGPDDRRVEIEMTLAERAAEWSNRVTRMLRQQLQGPQDGELRRAFTRWVWETARQFVPSGEAHPPEMTLEEIEMTLMERAAEWSNQLVREGVQKGIEQGIEQGLAHERALLRRQAASRFGAGTAERLSEALAGIADPEGLAEVGEWLVRCETGAEFLARVVPPGTQAAARPRES